MKMLSESNAECLVQHVYEKEMQNFRRFAQSPIDCCDSDRMAVFVQILYKVVKVAREPASQVNSWAKSILEKLADDACISFWGGLATFIRKLPYANEGELDNEHKKQEVVGFIAFCFDFLFRENQRTKYLVYLPLDDFHAAVKQMPNLDTTFEETVKKVSDLVQTRNQVRECLVEDGAMSIPNTTDTAGAELQVLPTAAELADRNIPKYLQRIKQVGSYTSAKSYLDLHFNLLREDVIHPLKCDLHQLQQEEDRSTSSKHKVSKYTQVRLKRIRPTRDGLAYLVEFEKKRVRWEFSKRLTYGALLCFSKDNFATVTFGTVVERNIDDLYQNCITVRFIHSVIDIESDYEMIESQAYFEAYAPVLKRLRSIDPDDLRMARYLVQCESDVLPPIYLSSKGEPCMDLQGVICKCKTSSSPSTSPPRTYFLRRPKEFSSESQCRHVSVKILDETEWLKGVKSFKGLDQSQIHALRTALTRELALIQGPPGTGKTYIGIKLVEVLLKRQNCSLWNQNGDSPITVMCYTNHALDQFLEGVLALKPKPEVRRVGGRSKSETISSLNVRNHMERRWRNPHLKDLPILECRIQALNNLCRGADYNPLNYELYCSLLDPNNILHKSNPDSWLLQLDPESLLDEVDPAHLLTELENRENYEDRARFFLHQLGIPAKPQKEREPLAMNDVVYEYRVAEDDRRIFCDELPEDETQIQVKDLIANERVLKRFVRSMQQIDISSQQRSAEDENRRWFKTILLRRLKSLRERYQDLKLKKAIDTTEDELAMTRALHQADIIGFTTTGASKYAKVLSNLGSKILIVEEAAEVLEAHIIAALTKHTEHLILIGDHKQLRPKPTDYTLAKEYHLELSLFERLVKNGFYCSTLTCQHRMRPEICHLIHPHIYPELTNHKSVMTYDDISGICHNLFFIDHTEPEEADEDLTSHSNRFEAAFLANLCQYLLQQGYKRQQITVITPYNGQVVCLKRAFGDKCITGVKITPVDHFQGEENDIILLSLVRSNKIGFVGEENRICVALSRAKMGFYCIGNFKLFKAKSLVWSKIIGSVKKFGKSLSLKCSLHSNVTSVSTVADFKKVPEGGCSEDCNTLKQCGHVCLRKCHPDDRQHEANCMRECIKRCEANHPCKEKCFKICPPCEEIVKKRLPQCGHIQDVPCHLDAALALCDERCEKKLPCGHRCAKKCSEPCAAECTAQVKRKWPCGHETQDDCYITAQQYMLRGRCKVPCNVLLACGHQCSGTCGQCRQGRLHIPCRKGRIHHKLLCGHGECYPHECSKECKPCTKTCKSLCTMHHAKCRRNCCDPCVKCAELCPWRCKHHECRNDCGELCSRPRCNQPCDKKLKCGHPCMGLCGEECPKLCAECRPKIERNIRFIQLCDCTHKVDDMDRRMEIPVGQDVKIEWKTCSCGAEVRTTPRYNNVIKAIQLDMERIKEQQFQRSTLSRKTRSKMLEECTKIGTGEFEKLVKLSDQQLHQQHMLLCVTTHITLALAEVKKLIDRLNEADLSEDNQSLSSECTELHIQLETFRSYLESRKLAILSRVPLQVFNDVHAERQRVLLLSKLLHIEVDCYLQGFDITSSEALQETIRSMKEKTIPPARLHNEVEYQNLSRNLKMLCAALCPTSHLLEEPSMMIRVLESGTPVGDWFKCVRGHYYQASDIDRSSTAETRCPECSNAAMEMIEATKMDLS